MNNDRPPIRPFLTDADSGTLLRESSAWVKERRFPPTFLSPGTFGKNDVLVEWSGASPESADGEDATRSEDSPFTPRALRETGQRLPGLAFLLEREHPGADGVPTGGKCTPENINLVRGVLWHACAVTVDELFEDIMDFPDGVNAPRDQWWTTRVLCQLPPRFVDRYNGMFVRKFLTTVVDFAHSLTNGWSPVPALAPGWNPVPTVAHGLAVRVLLNKTAQLAEIFEVEMPKGWREALEDNLCGLLDPEPLYRSRDNGEQFQQGFDVTDFSSWFTPLSPQDQLPPFLTA